MNSKIKPFIPDLIRVYNKQLTLHSPDCLGGFYCVLNYKKSNFIIDNKMFLPSKGINNFVFKN